MTSGSILTGIGGAFIDVNLTKLAAKAIHANALKTVGFVETSAAIETRFVGAIVNIDEAISALKAIPTFASVTTGSVNAASTVATRSRHGTFVNILATEAAGESEWTCANVVFEIGGRGASGTVGAVMGLAGVHFDFASFPGVGRLAYADKVVDVIDASSFVFARS